MKNDIVWAVILFVIWLFGLWIIYDDVYEQKSVQVVITTTAESGLMIGIFLLCIAAAGVTIGN